jgi:type II secretory pathway component PulK
VTAFAVTLIALVAVALAALTARVSTVAREAARDRERAQVEELIDAGVRMARQSARAEARSIELPDVLKEQAASLKLTPRGDGVEVEAALGSTRMTQVVRR